jgi:hypothetical protein
MSDDWVGEEDSVCGWCGTRLCPYCGLCPALDCECGRNEDYDDGCS